MTQSYIQYSRRIILCGVALLTLPLSHLHAQIAEPKELTEYDKEAIRERLEELEQASNDRISGLYNSAIAAYRVGAGSDKAALDLYLNCYEKVNFTDKHKDAADFREWKKKNDDKLGSKSFGMALKHQLMWLMLSIQAAKEDGDISEFGSKAISQLNNIFSEAALLKEHHSVVEQDALGSVFAKAYELNIKIKDWPKSGLDIEKIFEKLIFPKVKSSATVTDFRKEWDKKILYLGHKVDKWSGFSRRGGKGERDEDAQQTAMETFQQDQYPVLRWQMEMECYELGDQQQAAKNMIQLLNTHLQHKNAPNWIDAFQGLIDPVVVGEEVLEE